LVALACLTLGCEDRAPEPTPAPDVRSEAGALEEQRLPNARLGRALQAAPKAAPLEGAAPLQVRFAAQADGGTPPLTILWTFGDGAAPSSEADTVHTYEKPGLYDVTLSVKDAAADSTTQTISIKVR
jgi:PKD repeat protein